MNGSIQNKYNEQKAKGTEVASLLAQPGARARFDSQLKSFRKWDTRWYANGNSLGADERFDADVLFARVDMNQSASACISGPSQKRKPKRRRHRPSGPDPRGALLSIPEHSENEYSTGLVRQWFPPETVPALDQSRALCLQYVRLSVLHDMALQDDRALIPVIGNILDLRLVELVWKDMSDGWLSWRGAVDRALHDVRAELKAAGKQGEAEQTTSAGKRWTGKKVICLSGIVLVVVLGALRVFGWPEPIKAVKWIYSFVFFFAALLTCLHYLSCLKPIGEFICRVVTQGRGTSGRN